MSAAVMQVATDGATDSASASPPAGTRLPPLPGAVPHPSQDDPDSAVTSPSAAAGGGGGGGSNGSTLSPVRGDGAVPSSAAGSDAGAAPVSTTDGSAGHVRGGTGGDAFTPDLDDEIPF